MGIQPYVFRVLNVPVVPPVSRPEEEGRRHRNRDCPWWILEAFFLMCTEQFGRILIGLDGKYHLEAFWHGNLHPVGG